LPKVAGPAASLTRWSTLKFRSASIAGSFDVKSALARLMPGNDDIKELIRPHLDYANAARGP
jgi:hypothetical protein